MGPTKADQPASRSSAGWLVLAAATLIAVAVAANIVWIFASQGLRGPGGVFFERLLALLGGRRVAFLAAVAAGWAGAFLLYAARWPAILAGPGLAGHERRYARVTLSVAVSAILLAIPAHSFFYLLESGLCEEFCGLPALLMVHAAGVVALVAAPSGLGLIRTERDLILRVCVPLGIVTTIEPWLTLVAMGATPPVGVALNTAGLAGLLVALVGLIRARPRPTAHGLRLSS
jgi:hypothetical protein